MKKKHNYLTLGILLASLGAIIYGFQLKPDNEALAHKFIGFGTLSLFFVAMPLFLIKESKGKNMKDYMLTKENIDKMKNKEGKKTNNSQ